MKPSHSSYAPVPSRLAGGALSLLVVLGLGGYARAETTLAGNSDGWEIYATGRVGVFAEVLKGDSIPQAYSQVGTGGDPSTPPTFAPVHPVGNGGIVVAGDPVRQPDGTYRTGPILASRVRSGFLGNIFGFGVRHKLTESTVVTGHIAIWGTAETEGERTFYRNYADWREGYVNVEGPAGTLRVGRALSLFSRGELEIDYLYAHQYGVGSPAGFSLLGPAGGHIGYGVVSPVWVAGVSYATPRFHGFQLTAGYYDPGALPNNYWTRTKLGRPEAEATYDASLGSFGKLHLFANGVFQKLYATDLPRSATVYGVGGGGRIELGIFHLGVASHSGRGIGAGYFLDVSDAVVAQYSSQALRKFTGYYIQAQLAFKTFDLNAGWGMTRVYVLPEDIDPSWCTASGGTAPCPGFEAGNQPSHSFLKSQTGYSGVFVYHVSSNLHVAVDYFLSDARWQQGEKQLVHAINLGSSLTW
jgi:hypothetical protein